jgi:membrane protease YdiL (CAAX protease family)
MTHVSQQQRLLGLALLGIAPFLVNGLVNSAIAASAPLYWGFEMLTWIVIPASIAWAATRVPGIGFADFGFHGAIRGQRNIGLLLLVCMLFAPLVYGVYRTCYDFFSAILPAQGFFQYESVVPQSGMLYFVVVVYFALSAGLVEEFLFRGMLHKALAGMRQALPLFLLLSPLLFSLVHWEDGIANLVSTYIVGLFMALAYLGLRNLWPLVAGHVFTDLVWFG